jgi:predicted restriction endonuclease
MKQERIDYRAFWRHVTNDGKARCALADAPCHRCGGTGCRRCHGRGKITCSTVIDAHHFVPKRRLPTIQAKQDVRNGVCLCRDHHDLVEQGYLRSPRPPLLQFFLSEHDVNPDRVPTAAL